MVSVILYLVIHSITLKRLVKDALQLETIRVQSAGIDKNPLYLFKVTVSVVESLLLWIFVIAINVKNKCKNTLYQEIELPCYDTEE